VQREFVFLVLFHDSCRDRIGQKHPTISISQFLGACTETQGALSDKSTCLLQFLQVLKSCSNQTLAEFHLQNLFLGEDCQSQLEEDCSNLILKLYKFHSFFWKLDSSPIQSCYFSDELLPFAFLIALE